MDRWVAKGDGEKFRPLRGSRDLCVGPQA